MFEILFLCLIAYLGGMIQGLTGFGVMLVALPLMAIIINIKTAIPLILLLGLVMNVILICQLARHVHTKNWLPLLIASLPGVPVGVYILKTVDERWLEMLVGGVIIGTVVVILRHGPSKVELNKYWTFFAGFSSGLLGASIGAAGPPVIVYTAMQPWSKYQIKATLVAFFCISGVLILALQFFSNLITSEVVHLFIYCIVPLLLGVFTGHRLFDRIKQKLYNRAIYILLFILGVIMLLKGVVNFG
ncbi:sulfite exporter TauE/SafE family protein [Flexistipes sinusarabici]|uniref:Probable membrane transporter protein n=1 Tax=Flexistipes sinusarabici TaxID=2352 RepID=A0A3D5QDY6_FLESI|nr:sulfite exporter TauE/SafE family protein [Flexistipes sinusarabici]HCW93860.1 hypothetical protein [Flexistipes sinusarabici]